MVQNKPVSQHGSGFCDQNTGDKEAYGFRDPDQETTAYTTIRAAFAGRHKNKRSG